MQYCSSSSISRKISGQFHFHSHFTSWQFHFHSTLYTSTTIHPSNPNLSLQDDMMIPNNNGFVDPAKLKEQITLVPLNVYSSESDDSDMDHNGIPDIDPGKWLSLSL